jgi:hypothetical protein
LLARRHDNGLLKIEKPRRVAFMHFSGRRSDQAAFNKKVVGHLAELLKTHKENSP